MQRIGLADIAEAPTNWYRVTTGAPELKSGKPVHYQLRDHRKEAIAKIREGFTNHESSAILLNRPI